MAVAQTSLDNGSVSNLHARVLQSEPNARRVELLLKLSTAYLNQVENRLKNQDSALVFARQAEELSRRLHLKQGEDGARFLMGSVYARQQATSRVRAVMHSVSDSSRIKLVLALGSNKLDADPPQPTNRDSALFFFRQAQHLSVRTGLRKWQEECWFQLSRYYLASNNLPQMKASAMQVIAANQRTGDKVGEGRAWFRWANIFPDSLRFKYLPEKLSYLAQARSLAHQVGDQSLESLSLTDIAYIHADQGKYEQAENELLATAKLQEAIGEVNVYATYDAISTFEVMKGNYHTALAYCLKTIDSIKHSGYDNDLDTVYKDLAQIYSLLGEDSKAVAACRESLAISQRKGLVMESGSVVKVLTIGLIKLGKEQEALTFLRELLHKDLPYSLTEKRNIIESMARCYGETKQYHLAEKCWLQALALSQREGEMDSHYNTIGGISSFYVATRQYRKAEPYLKQILAAGKGIIPLSNVAETQLDYFKVDSAAGNYLSAIAHFRQHKALTDSIFTQAKSRQLQQLQVKYETGQKEQRIQLLTAKGQQQQSELKRTQTARNSLLGGAVLLSLLLGVSYSRYRGKQRSTALLEVKQQEINQQNRALEQVLGEKEVLLGEKDDLLVEKDGLLAEKEWMLKEIHHRVKNNLQIISSLLSRQSHYLRDAPALAALRESQNRVQAMALIHQKLYQSDSLARVNMHEYTQDILARLVDSFDCRATIGQHVDAVGVDLEVALATPVGLIINEAVTNALKHAFPHQRPGTIAVGLHELAEGGYELRIDDNGVGWPAGFDAQTSRSLGLTIIQGLSKQLHGRLTLTGDDGVHLRLQFAPTQRPA